MKKLDIEMEISLIAPYSNKYTKLHFKPLESKNPEVKCESLIVVVHNDTISKNQKPGEKIKISFAQSD